MVLDVEQLHPVLVDCIGCIAATYCAGWWYWMLSSYILCWLMVLDVEQLHPVLVDGIGCTAATSCAGWWYWMYSSYILCWLMVLDVEQLHLLKFLVVQFSPIPVTSYMSSNTLYSGNLTPPFSVYVLTKFRLHTGKSQSTAVSENRRKIVENSRKAVETQKLQNLKNIKCLEKPPVKLYLKCW
jgi:hypothetical protein